MHHADIARKRQERRFQRSQGREPQRNKDRGSVKNTEMLRAQHIPCWGEIGQERERKQMRGPSRETRGNSGHSRKRRLEDMKQQGAREEHKSVWLCTSIQGVGTCSRDRRLERQAKCHTEKVELCPAGMGRGPQPSAKEQLSSIYPFTCQQKAT